MPATARYTRPQIRLHWLTAALILGQYVFSDAIAAAWRARLRGAETGFDPLVPVHVLGGIAILLLVGWRLILRRRHGAPEPQGGPVLRALAKIGHAALYAALAAMAVSGGAAWFGAIPGAAAAHNVLKLVLIALILGHALAAFWHHFALRDGTLARMR